MLEKILIDKEEILINSDQLCDSFNIWYNVKELVWDVL